MATPLNLHYQQRILCWDEASVISTTTATLCANVFMRAQTWGQHLPLFAVAAMPLPIHQMHSWIRCSAAPRSRVKRRGDGTVFSGPPRPLPAILASGNHCTTKAANHRQCEHELLCPCVSLNTARLRQQSGLCSAMRAWRNVCAMCKSASLCAVMHCLRRRVSFNEVQMHGAPAGQCNWCWHVQWQGDAQA